MQKIFHADAGHGWLAVKRAELEQLGIADKISAYSYQRGDTVYLEEDCDASLYVQAMKKVGITVTTRESYKDRSPIRSYERYAARKVGDTMLMPTKDGKTIKVEGKKITLQVGGFTIKAFIHQQLTDRVLSHYPSGRKIESLTALMAHSGMTEKDAAQVMMDRVVQRVGTDRVLAVFRSALVIN